MTLILLTPLATQAKTVSKGQSLHYNTKEV